MATHDKGYKIPAWTIDPNANLQPEQNKHLPVNLEEEKFEFIQKWLKALFEGTLNDDVAKQLIYRDSQTERKIPMKKLTPNQIRSAIELYARQHKLAVAIVRNTRNHYDAAIANYRQRLGGQR
jgi:hypothetical protein